MILKTYPTRLHTIELDDKNKSLPLYVDGTFFVGLVAT